MPRARLTDAERADRRRARFTDAAYSHYDPTAEGYGSAADWISAAERMASGKGSFRVGAAKPGGKHAADLDLLGLDVVPGDVALLKRAFRNMLFTVHPDHGGTNEAARNVMEAYKRLLSNY